MTSILTTIVSREVGRWRQSVHRMAAGGGGPDAVHQLRNASRRCREALRLMGNKIPSLGRFSHALGPARDAEMLWQRLKEVRHPSIERRRLIRVLDGRRQALRRRLVHQLRSPAVRRLSDVLQARARNKPLDSVDEIKRVHTVLHKAHKRLRRLWKSRPKKPTNAYLHPLRRAIRRLRYAAELSAPFDGKHLKQLAHRAAHWQGFLGDCQDALIAKRLFEDDPSKGSKNFKEGVQND